MPTITDGAPEQASRVRRRSALPGPEHTLVSAALTRHAGFISRQQLFQEPAVPTGFPDLVIVLLSRERCHAPPARLRLTDLHLQLLQHISSIGRSTIQDIAADLLLRPRKVTVAVGDLAAARVVFVEDGGVEARPLSEIFVARRIIAVEAKVRDWRNAIEQARANSWFASHSLILLPAERFNDRVAEAALDAAVGVLTFDGAKMMVPVKPIEHPIPASYGSWLFNEWALHRVIERTGDA
ncbi:MAG: hypothetical protein ACRD1B_10535 [Thermoanaerobaculia bacterium]